MLITHVKPTELWGKKVYATNGLFLGEVVAIGSRRGVVRKVVVQRGRHAEPVRLAPLDDAKVQGRMLVIRLSQATTVRLRLVR